MVSDLCREDARGCIGGAYADQEPGALHVQCETSAPRAPGWVRDEGSVCSDSSLEATCATAGRFIGPLVHPSRHITDVEVHVIKRLGGDYREDRDPSERESHMAAQADFEVIHCKNKWQIKHRLICIVFALVHQI